MATIDGSPATPRPSRRERARAATIEEIKEIALRLMRDHGTSELRFSDIAREMGMTAPALYRYFTDRDDLLTALIVDAYDDVGSSIVRARGKVDEDDLPGRFLATAGAYREWANREPQRFALAFGTPVPGYVAPEEGPTTEAANRAMDQLKSLFAEAAARGMLGEPLITEVDDALLTGITYKDIERTPDDDTLSAAMLQACLHCWASIHGFVSLEAYGHFHFLTPQARDAVFISAVRLAATTAGFQWPEPER